MSTFLPLVVLILVGIHPFLSSIVSSASSLSSLPVAHQHEEEFSGLPFTANGTGTLLAVMTFLTGIIAVAGIAISIARSRSRSSKIIINNRGVKSRHIDLSDDNDFDGDGTCIVPENECTPSNQFWAFGSLVDSKPTRLHCTPSRPSLSPSSPLSSSSSVSPTRIHTASLPILPLTCDRSSNGHSKRNEDILAKSTPYDANNSNIDDPNSRSSIGSSSLPSTSKVTKSTKSNCNHHHHHNHHHNLLWSEGTSLSSQLLRDDDDENDDQSCQSQCDGQCSHHNNNTLRQNENQDQEQEKIYKMLQKWTPPKIKMRLTDESRRRITAISINQRVQKI